MVRRCVTSMSDSEKRNVLGREDEIVADAAEVFMLRREIFLELGFTGAEASVFARCRLDSPGIRTLIKMRVEVTRHATPSEIERINGGCGGTLRGLINLYGEGGLYGRKTNR